MFDVATLLSTFGLAGICFIIFLETGLLIGFIFPGDTLLFTAGMMAHATPALAPIWLICLCLPLAAILGDQCGYAIGKFAGQKVLKGRIMSWIAPEHVDRAHQFFDRYGAFTVFVARFIAVVRTITPLLAGISGMNYRKFTFFSVLGSCTWGAGIPLLGYLLGEIPFVQRWMHWFIVIALLAVLIPMLSQILITALKTRRRQRLQLPVEPFTLSSES